MRKLLPIVGLILAVCSLGLGQESAKSPCPTISVDGPSGIVDIGQTAVFSLHIVGATDTTRYEYMWTLSTDRKFEGQGTTTITIPIRNNSSLTASVDVKGLPAGCPTIASEVYSVDRDPGAEKLGTIPTTSLRVSKHILTYVKSKVFQDPYGKLYIALQFPKGTSQKTMERSRQRLADQLKGSKIPLKRIMFALFDNNNRETIFWIVPAGASLPLP